jgi:hypothetical protein
MGANQDHILPPNRHLHPVQRVIFIQVNGNQTIGSNVLKFAESHPLDPAETGYDRQLLAIGKVRYRQHCRDFSFAISGKIFISNVPFAVRSSSGMS